MTKERRLAIQMWEEIVEALKCETPEHPVFECKMKTDFCRKHGLDWYADCWFCHYIDNCIRCPISEGGCNGKSPFRTLINSTSRLERVKAARHIIAALKGKWSTKFHKVYKEMYGGGVK